jgi:glycolate oxidase iron-sulfur subunit
MADAAPPCQTPHDAPLDADKLLQACIHCGMCLSSCPTYGVTGNEAESPRGRLYLMQQWRQGHIDTADDLAPYLDHCLGCLNCESACPSGVRYGSLLTLHRAELLPLRRPSPWRWLRRLAFTALLPSPWLLEAMAWSLRLYHGRLRRVVERVGLLAVLARLAPGLAHAERLSPVPGVESPPLTPGLCFGNPQHPTVALHVGCLMNAVFRPVHWATIKVLVANQYHVVVAEQTCCGALAHHAGELDVAKGLAQQNLNQWQGHAHQPQALLFNSAGCGAELHDYPHLFDHGSPEHEQARTLALASTDVAAWLLKDGSLPVAPSRPVPLSVTYHAACHLHHAQRIQQQPVALLHAIEGLTLHPLTDAERCCGSAGIYNLQHPTFSEPILAEKMEHILATQADVVVTGNPGCQLQLQHGLRSVNSSQRVCHPMEVLAQAYPPQPGVWEPVASP